MAKKSFLVLLFFILIAFAAMPSAHAHCPLCTAAVGAAAISAKYYGLDVSIIGLLIGAFGVSTGLWAGRAIKREYFKLQLQLIVLASFLLTVIPLMYISSDSIYMPLLWLGQPGAMLNKVYWINKILFGSTIGGLAALAAFLLHNKIKKIRGKVLFLFQGIAITLAFLLISSLALYASFS